MAETNKYKIEKLGVYWHLLRLYYVGWWIFREEVWLTNFTYYWCKEDAEQALDEVSRCCESDSEQLSCKCGLPKRKQGIGFSCMRTDCDANITT